MTIGSCFIVTRFKVKNVTQLYPQSCCGGSVSCSLRGTGCAEYCTQLLHVCHSWSIPAVPAGLQPLSRTETLTLADRVSDQPETRWPPQCTCWITVQRTSRQGQRRSGPNTSISIYRDAVWLRDPRSISCEYFSSEIWLNLTKNVVLTNLARSSINWIWRVGLLALCHGGFILHIVIGFSQTLSSAQRLSSLNSLKGS